MSFTFDIQANIPKNRLYLRLVGFMSDEDAATVADRIISEVGKLKTGFAIINDISGLKPASQVAAEHLRRAQDLSIKRGSGRIIRVVGSQAITQMQWNRTLKESQGKAAEVAATFEDAEKMLDQGS
jgi:hypothetical protein